MKYEYPLVEAIWLDAETTFGWEETHETDLSPALAITVGFVVGKNEHYISIASTYSGNSCNSRIKIPLGMLQTLRILKPVRARQNPEQNLLSVVESLVLPKQPETTYSKSSSTPVDLTEESHRQSK